MSSKGKCYYCGREISKRGILRHLEAYKERKKYLEDNMKQANGKMEMFILKIEVDERYQCSLNDYWMYIGIDKRATLKKLDQFLRDIWLECCGHLSKFTIEELDYESEVDYAWCGDVSSKNMDIKIKDVLQVGIKANYIYDYGSSTSLQISVLGDYKCGKNNKDIELMTRNNLVDITCDYCDKKALYYCYDRDAHICENCIGDNDCEEIMEINNSNSPRDGVCGYFGDIENEKQYLPENRMEL